jgi:hypothetical protein
MLHGKTMITALYIGAMHLGVTTQAQPLVATDRHAALVPLRGDPKYSYIQGEIERLSRSPAFECRNIAVAARSWWDNGRVYGFRERIGVTDAITGLSGYLGGEARAPEAGGESAGTYEIRLYLANRTRNEILKTFRHESAHAAGIADERAARAWAEKCH